MIHPRSLVSTCILVLVLVASFTVSASALNVTSPQLTLSFNLLGGSFPGGAYGASLATSGSIYAYGGQVSGTAATSTLYRSTDAGNSWISTSDLYKVFETTLFLGSVKPTVQIVAAQGRHVNTNCGGNPDIIDFAYVDQDGKVLGYKPTTSQRRSGAMGTFWRPLSVPDGVGLLIGGTLCGVGYYNDVWVYSSSSLTPSGNTPFEPRSEAGITTLFDETRVLVAGGVGSNGYLSDVWMGVEVPNSLFPKWAHIGNLPRAAKYRLASTSDNTVFALPNSDVSSDLYFSLDAGFSWETVSLATSFPAREGASLVIFGQSLFILGGRNGNAFLNDGWVASLN